MSNLEEDDDENFENDELVDIINPKGQNTYEGKIISVKGDKIIVENLTRKKEEAYDKSEKRVIKQWVPSKPIKLLNRVDLKLKGTEYWVEGIVVEIKQNNKILIRYKNNNNFKRIAYDTVDINDNRLAKAGFYTKYDGSSNTQLLNSASNNLEESLNFKTPYNRSSNINLLNNKRKIAEDEEEDINKLLKTDDDVEETNFKKSLFEKKLKIKVVRGDGNCLFRAISDQVYGTDKHYNILRRYCMDYLVINKRYFEPYIDEEFDEYIKDKRRDTVWGDDVEIEVLSEIYNRPVEIYRGSNNPLKTFHEYNSVNNETNDYNFSLTPIRLSYHRKNHYNSIVPLASDPINFRKYKDAQIKTKPGTFESKIIAQVKREEDQVDTAIKISDKEYTQRLKNNLSNKIEDLTNNNDLNEKEENIENKEKEKREEKEDKDKDKEKNKEKDKEKNKENDTSKKDITKLNKIDSFTNNFGPYLSNEEIQFALDSGFDFNDIMDAIERNNGNFELAVNQLINHQDRDNQ